MREILFRAKRCDNGEWVEGTPFLTTGACKMIQAVALHPDFTAEEGSDGHVYYCEGWPVDPETVDQYTGLTDKHGVRIFEGDIIKAVLHGGNYDQFEFPLGIVIFEHGAFSLKDRRDTTPMCSFAPAVTFEIIGNIHDAPEQIEKWQGEGDAGS